MHGCTGERIREDRRRDKEEKEGALATFELITFVSVRPRTRPAPLGGTPCELELEEPARLEVEDDDEEDEEDDDDDEEVVVSRPECAGEGAMRLVSLSFCSSKGTSR